ncbi:methyl-accepting chemotaxis protein [Sporosarcina beigongshangi]|uniref:methyl-accepting chemotaxis protein n=1 Tax=Sporosarcina beigongshangi TaxID=2782538 RepID=UPI0019392844|nr:HAMP domain-containing methyl-accepting chemotaxis protein [Sporosarcina beigongshangi]
MGLRNAKIGKKLFILISLSVVIFFLIGGTGFYYMQQMKGNSEQMYRDALLPIKWQSQIRTNSRAVDGYTLEMLLSMDIKMKQELETLISERIEESKELEINLEESLLSATEKEKMDQFRDEYERYKVELQKVIDLALEGENEVGYTKYEKELKESLEVANTLMQDIEVYLETYADELDRSITASVKRSNMIVIIVIFIALVLKVTLGIVIARMIIHPLKEIETLMVEAEHGDLTVEGKYRSKDEIGVLMTSFNSMVSRLRELMMRVNNTSEQVAASSEQLTASAEESTKASEEVAQTIQGVAHGAERQVEETKESKRIVEEMTESIHLIASNTQEISANAIETSQKALEGNEAIQSTIKQMGSINMTVSQLSSVVEGLGERSREIGNIIEEITNIATQTNLLALNAAIESARAGEHGKGFAVVADEVRKLAEQSAGSAQTIAQMIALIQEETQVAVQSMQQATNEVTGGIEVVNKAGESFAQIRTSVDDVASQLKSVSATAQQISVGVDRVLQSEETLAGIAEDAASSTQNVAASTEEQLASMEEIAASAESLSHLAVDLQEQIEFFKV